MKIMFTIASYAICVSIATCAFARTVTKEEAAAVAVRWLSENRDMDMNPGAITGVVTSADLGLPGPMYYVALKRNGGRIYLSSDTSFPPVMAFVQRHGKDDLSRFSVLSDMLKGDFEKMVSATNSVPLSSSILKSSPSWQIRNERSWRSLLSTNMVLKSVIGTPSSYILPGFEYGGVLTHWSQAVDENGVPLYNGYMISSMAGGLSDSSKGLNLRLKNGYYKDSVESSSARYREAASYVPCGCVATAWAAVLQYMAVTGTVSSANNLIQYPNNASLFYGSDTFNGIDWTSVYAYKTLIPGGFDWSVLPSNLGGSSSESTIESMPTAARELIARVTYNCGLLSDMRYGYLSSSAYTSSSFSRIAGGDTITGFSGAVFKSSWDYQAADSIIRSGRPVIMSISNSSLASGHCVVGVGRREKSGDYAYTYIFMGWGGEYDGWYNTDDSVSISGNYDTINGMGYAGSYGNRHVPVYGQIIGTSGAPVYISIGTKTNIVAFTHTDDDGYFRTFYPVQGSSPVVQYVIIGNDAVMTNLSRQVSVGWNTLKSGSCGVVTASATSSIPGFDYVIDGNVSELFPYASAAGVDLVVYSGNSSTGLVSDVVSAIDSLGQNVIRCYATSLDGGRDGEAFVIDPVGTTGNNPTNWTGKIVGYWSFYDSYDNAKKASSVRRK